MMGSRRRAVARRVAAVAALAVAVGVTGSASPAGAEGISDVELKSAPVPAVVASGQQVTYTLTVRNTGLLPVVNVALTDTAPAGGTFVAGSSDPCWTGTGPYTCSVGALSGGQSVQLQITFVMPAGDRVVTNSASVGGFVDPNTSNNTTSSTSFVAAPATEAALMTDGDQLAIDGRGVDATFSIPDGADAEVVVAMSESGAGAFCSGPCSTSTLTIDFPIQIRPIDDPRFPGRLVMTFSGLSACMGVGNDCHPLFYTDPNKGTSGPVLPCVAGTARLDGPCLDRQYNSGGHTRTVEVLLLSNDPGFGLK